HEDTYYATKSQLIDSIMIALGGRAAEEIAFGEISTGASSDLQSCNSIARDMITKYGMSEKLGNLVFGSENEVFLGKDFGHVKDYSEKLAAIIDDEVKSIIDDAYTNVLKILHDSDELVNALANLLLEKEKIEGPEFEALILQYKPDIRPLPLNSAPRTKLVEATTPEANDSEATAPEATTPETDGSESAAAPPIEEPSADQPEA
ncbi:MAG: hypothetical protein PHC86_01410, partial [Eubacteriales bacterium]|nr:hypothetical protein [Eubacteriales bacterium]